jgi:hypothetical protein
MQSTPKLVRSVFALAPLLALTACAGTRSSGDLTTAYATSFNLVGLSIPFNDYEKAESMVPENADIETIIANPRDWSSIMGILNSILGFSSTQISWAVEKE